MTAAALTGADGFLARYAELRDRLPGDRAARDAAAAAFRRAGLPGRRVEAWKYTDLRPIASAAFQQPLDASADVTAIMACAPRRDAPSLVFVNGRFRADLSRMPDRLRFSRFRDDPRFGGLARPDSEPLAALNAMLAEDGAVLHVPAGADAGLVHLISIGTGHAGDPGTFHPRHAISLDAGARLVLLETLLGDGSYLHAPVSEIRVADGATLTHVRLQDEATAAFSLATLYVEVAADGTYDGFTLNAGARMARCEFHACLAGSGATLHLNGAQLLAGTQHADFTSVVRHAAPHGTSRQTVKNVLEGRARAVFQGRIEVARLAQKTDGYQMSQTLLLSPEAEIDTKPELEIFADDVKCSHGATVGELDAEQLFYLRSRGIPEAEAHAMLVRAFLAGALDAVTQPAARAVLEDAVQTWWERQAA